MKKGKAKSKKKGVVIKSNKRLSKPNNHKEKLEEIPFEDDNDDEHDDEFQSEFSGL